MDLVTLTFKRDLRHTVLQAESIQKFVSPCDHWVIVNEFGISEKRKQRWRKILQPYYTRHRLRLWFPDDLENANTRLNHDNTKSSYFLGFKYQFTVAQFLDDDYVVLNAKNFFVKPINLESWRNILGSGWKRNLDASNDLNELSWKAGNLYFARYLKTGNRDATMLGCVTPQVVDRKLLIDHLEDFKDFNEFWDNTILLASEKIQFGDWYFYSHMIPEDKVNVLPHNPDHYTLFWQETFKFLGKSFKELLKEVDNTDSVKMVGFHRFFLRNLSAPDRILLNKWLREKGFKTKLRPPTKFYK
jgi:hypothetical protein